MVIGKICSSSIKDLEISFWALCLFEGFLVLVVTWSRFSLISDNLVHSAILRSGGLGPNFGDSWTLVNLTVGYLAIFVPLSKWSLSSFPLGLFDEAAEFFLARVYFVWGS